MYQISDTASVLCVVAVPAFVVLILPAPATLVLLIVYLDPLGVQAHGLQSRALRGVLRRRVHDVHVV